MNPDPNPKFLQMRLTFRLRLKWKGKESSHKEHQINGLFYVCSQQSDISQQPLPHPTPKKIKQNEHSGLTKHQVITMPIWHKTNAKKYIHKLYTHQHNHLLTIQSDNLGNHSSKADFPN